MSGSASSSPSYLSAIGDTFALLLNTPLVEPKAEAVSKGKKPEPVQLQEITRGSSRKAMGGTSLPDVSSVCLEYYIARMKLIWGPFSVQGCDAVASNIPRVLRSCEHAIVSGLQHVAV